MVMEKACRPNYFPQSGFLSNLVINCFLIYPVELSPGDCHIVIIFQMIHAAVEELLGKKEEVLFGESTTALDFRLELHVESLTQLGPHHFVWHSKGHTSWLCKSVVPQHCGSGIIILAAVHNYHHWQR